jgi:hypothetical protein
MASAQTWLELLAWTKALFDTTKASIDLTTAYLKYRHDPETIQESQRVSVAFSTYSEEEVKSLLNRMKGCQDRFVAQGGGLDRARCICSVLQEAKDGNGGVLPLIDDWQNIYAQLHCGS